MSDRRMLESLYAEENRPFTGWDFTYIRRRMLQEPLLWDYDCAVRAALSMVDTLLDMGTGGGERLASFAPLPKHTSTTEAYAPNVLVAQQRLEPLGIRVYQVDESGRLPFEDVSFDLVINRHTFFDASEVRRVLKPGGRFITQQVGSQNLVSLNQTLDASDSSPTEWTLAVAVNLLEEQRLSVEIAQEAFPTTTFLDVGALVYYLKAVSWQVSDFSVDRYRDHLLRLHQQIGREGPFQIHAHRFFLLATRPQ